MFIPKTCLAILLAITPIFAYATDKRLESSSNVEVVVGLYQSEPFELNSPNASAEPHRLYMRVFPEKKIALVISPATSEEIF